MSSYIKVFCDMSETVDELSDAEAGRLFKALLHYGNDETVDQLPGQEKIVYKILKATIDRDREAYNRKAQAQRENGAKGGRPRKPKETHDNPQKPMGFKSNPNNPNPQEKEKEYIPTYSPPKGASGGGGGFADEDELLEQSEANQEVYNLAADAGFAANTSTLDKLTGLIASHGAEAVKYGIGECVEAQVVDLRYLRKVCANYGKKRPSSPPEQQYKPITPTPADWDGTMYGRNSNGVITTAYRNGVALKVVNGVVADRKEAAHGAAQLPSGAIPAGHGDVQC